MRSPRWCAAAGVEDSVISPDGLAPGQAELERLVDARTLDLRAAQARLAHDLNNVLQTAQGAAVLLDMRADDPSSVRELAGMVLEATQRGAAIARRLLDLSQRGAPDADPAGAPGLAPGSPDSGDAVPRGPAA